MANIHSLIKNGSEVTVAVHVAIPSANNSVSVNYQVALIGSGVGGKTVLPDGNGMLGTIAAAEKTAILNGSLYEEITTLRVDSVPGAGINAFLDAEFTRISGEVLARLQNQLKYWGFTR